ncbi:MAG: sugar phosphate nucleotidyltransferase [Oscillospiraceae bacterium]|nr:sugar phosphate nucleotidyltransferase [Oscillospiraceae bacterium]
MQIIMLSGGSGKRLWPLSNDIRSKQFLKILVDEYGNPQSMAQRVYGQICEAYPQINITVATNISQVDSIRSHMGENVNIVLEPERRDTFPAIALSCAFLAYEKNVDYNETIAVLPVDSYTEHGFFDKLKSLDKIISSDDANLALIGIKPSLATSKYGYIIPGKKISKDASEVLQFVEKPEEDIALSLIEQGALWNGGVFVFKLKYVIDILRRKLAFSDFNDLRNRYNELDRISFDYMVVEREQRVAVVPYQGTWSDIGTWRTLADEMPYNVSGYTKTEKTVNTYIVNELEIPIIALGTKDLVIAASPDGILVSDLVESSQLKPVVDNLEDTRPMFEERRWGEYTVIAKTNNSLVKQLLLYKGKAISYQTHIHRDEIWVIVSGYGEFVLDGEVKRVKEGDTLRINRGQKHSIKAISDLLITEVQIGTILSEDDIERYPDFITEEAS